MQSFSILAKSSLFVLLFHSVLQAEIHGHAHNVAEDGLYAVAGGLWALAVAIVIASFIIANAFKK